MALKIKDTISGNINTTTKLLTGRSLTIGNTARTFDGSGNLSWSASEIGVYTKGEIDGKSTLRVLDNRNTNPTPNDVPSTSVSFTFNPNYGNGWDSGMTVKGWTNGYAAWQLYAGSSTSANENLKFRTGINTTWSAWRNIYHTGYKPTAADVGAIGAGSCSSISDWNAALKNGFYMASGAANAPNAEWWMGYCINHHDGWVIQVVNSFASHREWKQRYRINGSWGAWSNLGNGPENGRYIRTTTISTGNPTGGDNGDIWIKY